ncbi:MAG: HepT-like ribonuclease domain-containing protein [Methanoregula sp.]
MERKLITIGEAVKNVSPELRREYPDIPWRETTGTRDKIVHHYFGIDYESVFETIKIDLPELKHHIQTILATASITSPVDKKKTKPKTHGKKGS